MVDPAVMLCGFPKPHKLLWSSYKCWEFPAPASEAVLNRYGHSCDWSCGYRWAENLSWPSLHQQSPGSLGGGAFSIVRVNHGALPACIGPGGGF